MSRRKHQTKSGTRGRAVRVLAGVAIAEARKRPTRVVITLVTVALGTLVLTTALVLGASVQAAVDQGLRVQYPNVDVLLRANVAGSEDSAGGTTGSTTNDIPAKYVKRLRAQEEVAAVGTYVRTLSVAQVGKVNLGVTLESLADEARFRWQRISDGRAPSAPGEVALSRFTLHELHVGVGGQVALNSPAVGRVLYTVVGVVDTRGAMDWRNSAYGLLTTPAATSLAGTANPNTMVIQGKDGVSDTTLINKVNEIAPIGLPQKATEILDAGEAVQLGLVSALSIVVVALAGISVLVAGITSATTTGASLASRRRSWALARCIGADRLQIGALVAAESLVIGFLGAALGVIAGLAVARAALPAVGLVPGLPPIDGAAFTVHASAIYLPIILAVALSLLASIVPAWRAARIPPSAALQPNVEPPPEPSLVRLLVSLAAAVGGAVLAIVGAGTGAVASTAVGALLVVVGARALMARTIVAGARSAARTAGSVDVRLGLLDIVRRPRAAVIEAVALATAIGIMTLSWVALASFQEATSARLTKSTQPDLVVGAPNGSGSSTKESQSSIARIRGVAQAVAVPFGQDVSLKGRGPQGKVSVAIGTASGDASTWDRVLPRELPVAQFQPDTVYIAKSSYPPFFKRARVDLVGPDGVVRHLKVQYVEDLPAPSVVSAATLAKVSKTPDVRVMWLRLARGADRGAVVNKVQGIALLDDQQVSGPTVLDVRAAAAFGSARAAAAAILSIAVCVAAIGAAATAALSIKERAREHATLRALGLPRQRLARLLGTRVLFVSLMAALQGVIAGAILGVVVARFLADALGLSPAISIPAIPVVVVIALTVLAVRVAAMAPMERASYIPASRALAEG